MNIKTEYIDGLLIIIPSGRLDGHGAGLLQEALMTHMSENVRHIILNLADVPYISSAGIRIFLIARNLVKSRGGHVMLCNLGEFPKNVLTMAGMDRVFRIYDDLNQAFADIGNVASDPLTASPTHPYRYTKDNATLEILPAGFGPAVLKVSGSLTRVLHAGITIEDVEEIRFSDCEYSLGLGALAENKEQARSLLGEMITLHGAVVWLPTDGNGVPDYFIPMKETGGVEIYSGFTAALQGPFHEFFTMTANSPDGFILRDIYEGIFSHARATHSDYPGIVAIALIGESAGIRSSGIRHSPIPELAPEDGSSIMDPGNINEWIEVNEGLQYDGETVVTFGIGVDLKNDLTRFDTSELSSLYYIHPANLVSQVMHLHTHGVVFRHIDLGPEDDIGRMIKRIMVSGEFLDMRHLMDDSRFRSVRGAVAYISQIRTNE